MRTYGKKIIRNAMTTAVIQKQESRDAILWDVIPADRIGRVKIQGSNTYIIAHFPQNWESVPTWLKPGNAVRIIHVGGDRGKIEIAGMGRAIPTPVSGATFPTVGSGADCVLTGCYVSSCPNTPKMTVQVHVGTFRIGGSTYILGPISMAEAGIKNYGTYFFCGDGGLISDIAAALVINTAPSAGLFRYDLISVGADLVCDYAPGSAAAIPVKPAPASNHVTLAYILVPGTATKIQDTDINHDWVAPAPHALVMTITDKHIYWADAVTTAVRLQVFDQYGNAYSGNHIFSLEITSGNGSVTSGDSGTTTTVVTQAVAGTSYYDFSYTRNKADYTDPTPDISPMLKGVFESSISLEGYDFIQLFDSRGNLMTETPIPP